MKTIGKALYYVLMAVNILFALLLLLVAYSEYVAPEKYPLLSCAGLTFPVFLFLNLCFLVFWLIVHYKAGLVSLAALLLCAPQIRTYVPLNFRSNDLPAARIKILSYNVMAFADMERIKGENPVLQYIAKSGADIVCMQEYATSTADDHYVNEAYIKEMMKSYPYNDVTVIGDKGGSNRLALYSRFPILSSHRIMYKSDYNGSVYYDLLVGNDTVALINNHLESNKLTREDKKNYEQFLHSLKNGKVESKERSLLHKFADASVVRAVQARVIAKVINDSPRKTKIVCGDFNDSPLSYAHQLISENLTDAFTQSGCGIGTSYNRNKFFFRIDNILISKNLKSYNCKVDHSIKDSDHYPIWCYLAYK